MSYTGNQIVRTHIAKYLKKYGQLGNELRSVNRMNHERYLCQKIIHKMWWETSTRPFFKKIKIQHIYD